MRHTKQTRLTAALFAAAVGVSSAGSTAYAAFSPESQQIAAILYGPPPVSGDLNDDFSVDARDITLLKRYLMKTDTETGSVTLKYVSSEQDEYYRDRDINADFRISQDDVRAMCSRLIGDSRPDSFTAWIYLLAYLSDDPLTDAEQFKRVQDAYGLVNERFRVKVRTGASEWTEWITPITPEIGRLLTIKLPHPLRDPEKPGECSTQKAVIRFERIPQSDDDVSISEASGSFEIEINYVTSRRNEDGTLSFYDKCTVECDVVQGRAVYADPCGVNEKPPEPESLERQYDIYCDILNKMSPLPYEPEA